MSKSGCVLLIIFSAMFSDWMTNTAVASVSDKTYKGDQAPTPYRFEASGRFYIGTVTYGSWKEILIGDSALWSASTSAGLGYGMLLYENYIGTQFGNRIFALDIGVLTVNNIPVSVVLYPFSATEQVPSPKTTE